MTQPKTISTCLMMMFSGRRQWHSHRQHPKRLFATCLLFLLICAMLGILFNINNQLSSQLHDMSRKFVWPDASASPLGKYVRVAVAADNGYCSEIGRNAIIRGGNVIHAAIATTFCLGAMNPQSSGIGGGAIINIYNSTSNKCMVIDAKEVAPAAARKNMFVNNKEDTINYGWKASGVPGEVHGLYTAYKLAGNAVSWKSLIEPSIKILRQGQPVSHHLAKILKKKQLDIADKSFNLNIFMHPNGTVYKEGEVMKRPRLAETLEGLANAKDPIQYFYNSKLTNDLINDIQKGGGIITKADMQSYTSEIRSQSQIIYSEMGNGLVGCGPPPPSSSAVALSILKIMLACYPKEDKKTSFTTLDTAVSLSHRLIEAMKFAYAARSDFGDLNFVRTALAAARNVTSQAFVQLVCEKMQSTASSEESYYRTIFSNLTASSGPHGTSHIAIVDSEGNAVSMTTSINTALGAHRRSQRTGIIMNSQMDDFSTPGLNNHYGYPPSPNNYIEPGKRPLSSMSPIILFNNAENKRVLAVGCAGGSKISSATAYVTFRVLQLQETVKGAIDAPRIHNQLSPLYTDYEGGMPAEIVPLLSARGQRMRLLEKNTSVVTAAFKPGDDEFIYANSDFRKGGDSYCAGI